MTARNPEHPLADQVLERVPDLRRHAFVDQTTSEPLDEVVDPLRGPEQHGTAIEAGLLPVEGGHDRLRAELRAQNTLWLRQTALARDNAFTGADPVRRGRS